MQQYDSNNKGAAWIKTAKSGVKYMGGEVTINNQKYYISMFKNTKKVEGSNQPDYNIVLNLPQNQQSNNAQQTAQNVQNTFNPPVNDPFKDDSNIPF